MTAKEQLKAMVDAMSEQQAAAALETLAPAELSWDEWQRFLDDIAASIPEEELLTMPSSDRIDEVVYGHPPRE
ncbi:MAG: hypothetical protein IT303_09615 [Dehalococcoidia bacterium]|nr:hypothetical protein [Dehalococcoidia bacterium]